MMKILWFVACLFLGPSFSLAADNLDFDYCCLDCIPKSNYHIACRQRSTTTPGCRTYSQIMGGGSKNGAQVTQHFLTSTSTNLAAIDGDNSTVNATTSNATSSNDTSSNNGTTAAHISTDNTSSTVGNNSTSPTTATTTVRRSKRQLEEWNRIISDISSRRIDDDDLRNAINLVRSDWVSNLSVSNMEEMLYDEELGEIAEALASRCNAARNFCADSPGFEVNILTFNGTLNNGTNFTAAEVVNSWSRGREVLLTAGQNDNIYRNTNRNTDTFSLLIWATTSLMGCADAVFKRPGSNNSVMTYQITCLLGPAGNKIGQPMWQKGTACSACPPQTSCGLEGKLCTRISPRVYELDKNRTSRCVKKRDDSYDYYNERIAQELDRFREFDTGVKVVLKPRKICDPISSSGIRIIDRFWNMAAGLLLSHYKWFAAMYITQC